MPKSCTIVISAYNEEKTLASVFAEALATLQDLQCDFEIICCDDKSQDGTKALISTLVAACPQAKAIYHEQNQGMFKTFEELYQSATKDYVLLLPGDGQWHAGLLKEAFKHVDQYDVIIARRIEKQYTLFRHLNSWAFNTVIPILFGIQLYDIGSVKLFRREVLAKTPVGYRSAFTEAERLLKAHCLGFRIGHIDVEHRARIDGKGRGASMKNIINAVRDMIDFRIRQWPSLSKHKQ